jgi:gamma-glutamylcyclotransferase (GGCT)/AIG2-like uncharacterized protein YtfP
MEKNNYKVLRISGTTYDLPIFLNSDVDELGVMVGFDGDIEQLEQLCNFTYTANNLVLTVYNTASTTRLKKVVDAEFEINWGDNTANTTIGILEAKTHTYTTSGKTTVSITMVSPWGTFTTNKDIYLPLKQSDPTDLGSITFTIPYSETNYTQNYQNEYDYDTTNFTGTTVFFALGKSRIIEKQIYGSGYTGTTTGTTTISGESYQYTGYTLDNLNYLDLSDGTTYISGNTENFVDETEFVKKLTRNEHYLGFINEPMIYSDIFVERGKMGVSEFNLRLSEIDNLGELEIYGNGFFNVKKQ